MRPGEAVMTLIFVALFFIGCGGSPNQSSSPPVAPAECVRVEGLDNWCQSLFGPDSTAFDCPRSLDVATGFERPTQGELTSRVGWCTAGAK